MGAKFSTRLLTAAVHGIFLFTLLFFAGLLVEAALWTMGAMGVYNLQQYTIATILGALGFFNSIAYELSRRLDQEETKA